WAAGASPTRSRSSSASASRRAVTCASAASAWRRAVRSCVSCSLSSATRRRACSNAAAASAAARARAAASCARAPTWAVAAHSVSARRARSCDASASCCPSSARSLALPLRRVEAGPLLGQGRRQLLGLLTQTAERQIEVFELAAHQRQGDAEALLDHFPVALRFAALARQAPHLRLDLADQVL